MLDFLYLFHITFWPIGNLSPAVLAREIGRRNKREVTTMQIDQHDSLLVT